MVYSIRITVEPQKDVPQRIHRPVIIETLTEMKSEITDDELDAVTDLFKRQIRSIIQFMAKD